MGGRVHQHAGERPDGGRHAEPPTVAPTSVPSLRASLPLPPLPPLPMSVPATDGSPATGGSRSTGGSPSTADRAATAGPARIGGPATGSRRAPGRNLRWVPIALAIWIASFLAVPAAVLVHQAVTADDTTVEDAADTSSEGEAGSGAAGAPAAADEAGGSGTSGSSAHGSGTHGDGGSATNPAAVVATDAAGVPITTTGAAQPGQSTPAAGGTSAPVGFPSAGSVVVTLPGGAITVASIPATTSSPSAEPPVAEHPAEDPPAEDPPTAAGAPGFTGDGAPSE